MQVQSQRPHSPGTILFIQQYWNDNDIVRMMGVYSCKKDSHPSALKLFGLCEEDSPTTDFLSTWYVSLFRDFDFTPEIKANIVGSFFQTSRSKVWLDCICDGCTPYLNGVDLPLLHLAFGEDVQPDTEALTLLYTSVQSVARAEITPGLDVEPILRIAMDLQPVECALDLYHRACYAKEKILNPTPPCIELAYEY